MIQEVAQNVTFRPMTPRHTIDGIEAAIGLPRSAGFGSFLSAALFVFHLRDRLREQLCESLAKGGWEISIWEA